VVKANGDELVTCCSDSFISRRTQEITRRTAILNLILTQERETSYKMDRESQEKVPKSY
jgi:hypothetical protein